MTGAIVGALRANPPSVLLVSTSRLVLDEGWLGLVKKREKEGSGKEQGGRNRGDMEPLVF